MTMTEFLTKSKLKELGLDGLLGGFSFSMNFSGVPVGEFMLMQDKDFDNLRNIGKSKKNALIWLRDYLNGKESGKYEKEKISDNVEIMELREKIKAHKEKEENLCEKIKELEISNSELRKELNEYRKRENKYQKAKDLILSIE